MKRRGFLKGLFGAALVPVVGKGDGVSLMSIPHPPAGNACVEEMVSDVGFGLAPVKREGGIAHVDFIKQLRPGVEDVFKAHYENAPPMFSEDGITWTSEDDGLG